MKTFEQKLHNYAKLAVDKGVNIQPGQTLVIAAPIDAAPFVRRLAEAAYDAGAKHVYPEWADDELTKIKYEKAPEEAFHEFPSWRAESREQLAREGAAFITVKSTDPDLLKGVDPDKIANANNAAGAAMEGFRDYIQADRVSWLVISTPSAGWAKKVFPDEPEDRAIDLLWERIFSAVRADTEDPVQAWDEHNRILRAKVDWLNTKKYKSLHYTAPGTDLEIGLPDGHVWAGGGSTNTSGVSFIPNMPTEEVFTAPHKDFVNGHVTNTKPLNYGGSVIDQFTLHFKDGAVTDMEAGEGEETLRHLINSDEGAARLGEVALVPHSSPISQSGILFFNTLFDENASNHIALGSAYAFCVENGPEMSKEEKEQAGLNTSIIHVDFMIGNENMNIDGILPDGTKEPVFRNGEWAE
ncbi:aminopeptidase [Marinococcus luteus]|uniref:Aminopeptidase n=1 Tax=Marinococcus luteus TaxID=1122204 RepID=A0A1H2SBC8_9BACI|nr:aminopeptidase [Marinococcus luteus]SDW28926.1 aminopeptidase [Marinococcus luteus]